LVAQLLLQVADAFQSSSSSSSPNTRRRIRQQQQQNPDNNALRSKPKTKRMPANNNSNNNNRRNQQNNNNSAKKKFTQADRRRLNQKLVACETAPDLLQVLQNEKDCLRVHAGGGCLNSVNFSTALHRLARHCSANQTARTTRANVLTDPRFALFLASLGEALCSESVPFQSREISNIGWALAKLKLPPPALVMPPASSSSATAIQEQVEECSKQVRQAVLQVAADRKEGITTTTAALWIPALSQLAGHMLDHIGQNVCVMEAADDTGQERPFQMQEYANLLWAWATASRTDPTVVSYVLTQMIRQQKSSFLTNINKQEETSLRPQEWSNSIWALATAGISQESSWPLVEYVSELLETYHPDFSNRFKPQEWSNTVWGVATLASLYSKQPQHQQEPLTRNQQLAAVSIVRSAASYVVTHGAANFKTQELSNTLWAMATLGFGSTITAAKGDDTVSFSNNNNNNYVFLSSDQPVQDQQLMKDALKEILRAALPLLPRFRSQELNNLAWALARLVGDRNDDDDTNDLLNPVLSGIARQLANPRQPVTSQDIGTTLWALATLEFVDEQQQAYRGLAARLTPSQAHTYKPQELSNTLWALATAEVQLEDVDAFDTSLVPLEQRRSKAGSQKDPATGCFAIAARELMKRPHQFKSQEIKDVLWSYSKVGIRHPALFQSVAQYLLGGEATTAERLDEFSPQGLGNTAWAFARQAQLSADVSERLKGSSNLANSNGRLAVYTTSYIDVGELLLQRFFSAIAEADLRVHCELQRCRPQDLANTAWAFAVLGLKNVAFMEATKKELVDRTNRFVRGEVNGMTQFKGQELANLLWALATLNMPAGDILRVLAPYICAACQTEKGQMTAATIAKIFKRQELANMAWACAVFGEYPPDLMDVLYRGLVGFGKEQDPVHMSKIHGDQGLQSQAIMTLIYVQAAVDLAGSSQKSRLPENFPDGWKQLIPSQYNDHMTETSFDELNLSTSKMQRAVSNAFSRIGFDHVEEHVITMEEMSREHKINVAPKPMEILSIDIASVEDKIAIEVDGPAHYISRIDRHTDSEGGYSKLINGKLEYQFAWNGDQQEVNGPTGLKQRLLMSLGWKVIHLPFWDWYQLGGDSDAEERFCRDLLEQTKQR
jgi:hypothetical protein